jgi:ubiquinone/menaquinone biosynthesis C-methylase UbiE
MKRYFFVCVCFIMQLNGMEQSLPEKVSKEIIPLAGNKMYYELAVGYLKDSTINFKDKHVLDACCKDGEISHAIIDLVGGDGLVMGIDSDKVAIEKANKQYKQKQNLSFHEIALENFEPSMHSLKFHVVTLFHSFDVIDDKKSFCEKIHNALGTNGEFLVNVGSGEEPFDFKVTREMLKGIYLMQWIPGYSKIEEILSSSYLKEQDYRDIFEQSGFDIISLIKSTNKFVFTEEEFIEMKRPIVMSNCTMRVFPTKLQDWIFNMLMAYFLPMLTKDEDGKYIYPVTELLIHARKKDKK